MYLKTTKFNHFIDGYREEPMRLLKPKSNFALLHTPVLNPAHNVKPSSWSDVIKRINAKQSPTLTHEDCLISERTHFPVPFGAITPSRVPFGDALWCLDEDPCGSVTILSVNPAPGLINCEYVHMMLVDIGKSSQMDIFKTPSVYMPNNYRHPTSSAKDDLIKTYYGQSLAAPTRGYASASPEDT